ncbi:MAG: type III pantothenate kinase [Burkholderiales bacterium]
MLLVLDIGNTRLKWAEFHNGQIGARGAIFLAEVEHFVERAGFAARVPERVVGSHVANLVSKERVERQFAALGRTVQWVVSSATACGVRNGYDDPTRLGTDRWAAMVAAWQRGHAPCIVACAGTALTVDQLDDNGQFLGGAIVAGYHAMLGGLAGNTAALSVDAGDWAAQPTNTRDALATGAIDAMVGAIERGHMRLTQRLRERGSRVTPRIILTGGSAYRLLAHLPEGNSVIDSLVLEGVRLLAES